MLTEPQERQIEWEKYEFDFNKDNEEDDDGYKDSYDKSDDILSSGKMLFSPLGVFKVDDSLNPFKNFKFFKGSTNFSITGEIVDVIRQIPGVEVLKIISRYQFIIAPGKLFKWDNVRKTIEMLLCRNDDIIKLDELENEEILGLVKEQIAEIDDKFWSIYIFPNGELDVLKTNNESEYEGLIADHMELKTLSDGKIVTSKSFC